MIKKESFLVACVAGGIVFARVVLAAKPPIVFARVVLAAKPPLSRLCRVFARVVLAAKPPLSRLCREKRAPKARENSKGFQSVSSPFSARLLLLYQAKTLRARTIPPATQATFLVVLSKEPSLQL